MLPVNRSKFKSFPDFVDGSMNFSNSNNTEEVNQYPSAIRTDVTEAPFKYPRETEYVQGFKVRESIDKKTNDFLQAGDRQRNFDPKRQDRFVARVVDTLKDSKLTVTIIDKWIK